MRFAAMKRWALGTLTASALAALPGSASAQGMTPRDWQQVGNAVNRFLFGQPGGSGYAPNAPRYGAPASGANANAAGLNNMGGFNNFNPYQGQPYQPPQQYYPPQQYADQPQYYPQQYPAYQPATQPAQYPAYQPATQPVQYAQPAAPQYVLGVDAQPISDGDIALQVTQVYPDSAAERAGLKVGDIVRSSNGYKIQSLGNLRWVIAQSGGTLQMQVKDATTGEVRAVTASL